MSGLNQIQGTSTAAGHWIQINNNLIILLMVPNLLQATSTTTSAVAVTAATVVAATAVLDLSQATNTMIMVPYALLIQFNHFLTMIRFIEFQKLLLRFILLQHDLNKKFCCRALSLHLKVALSSWAELAGSIGNAIVTVIVQDMAEPWYFLFCD